VEERSGADGHARLPLASLMLPIPACTSGRRRA